MNWFDFILLVILAGSVLSSFRRGLSREVIGLVTVIAALVLGAWFYAPAGAFLLPYVSSPAVAHLCGFALVFVGVHVVGSLAGMLVGKMLKVTGLSLLDHVMGAGFGLLRGGLVAVALLMAVMAFAPGGHVPQAVVNSRVAPYISRAAKVCAAMAPEELREGFQRTYDQAMAAWSRAVKDGVRSLPQSEKTQ